MNALLPTAPGMREGNSVELLQGGLQFFPKALAAIEAANNEVRIETYIFANDETGHAFFEAMCNAARRGVAVRLILDGFGGQEGVSTWVPRLREQGVQVRVFRPEGFVFKPNPRRLRRMHRKMIAIDGELAFVGGINLIDDMNHRGERDELAQATARARRRPNISVGSVNVSPQEALQVNTDLLEQTLGPRYDFAVALRGPVVQDVWHSMDWLWLQVGPNGDVTDTFKSDWWKERFAQFKDTFEQQKKASPPPKVGASRVQLAVRDNFRARRRIEKAYLQAIGQAHTSVVLANAYFLPGRKLRRALYEARERGVVVKLLLQGRVEYRLQHYATQHLYSNLLGRGVEVFEYLPGFLHAKVAVVDSHWATVGSANLDPLSSLFAREANVLIVDRTFARDLKACLLNAMERESRCVDVQDHAQRPLSERAFSWVCYKLMQLAVFLGGFGSRY